MCTVYVLLQFENTSKIAQYVGFQLVIQAISFAVTPPWGGGT